MPEYRREYFKKRYECRKKEECLSRKERYKENKAREQMKGQHDGGNVVKQTETLEGVEQKNEPDKRMTILFICHDQDSFMLHNEQYWFAKS
jgi:hypothetical protein